MGEIPTRGGGDLPFWRYIELSVEPEGLDNISNPVGVVAIPVL